MRVKLPRLLNAQMQEKARLHPSEMDITFNLHSPHIASAVLPANDAPVALHDWVRLHTVKGDAGVFRVADIGESVGEETHLSLQHGICILKADKPKTDEEAIEGSLSELLAQLWAMEGVNETPQYWQLGSIPQTGTIRYVFGSQNLLQAVQTIMKQVKGYALSFDQSIFPWVLNVEKLPESVSCEGRFSRNLESVNIDMDDADLVTRVYIHGKAGFTDADTIGQWGVYSEILTVSEDATEESLIAYVADYLEAHKNPNVAIELSGVDLSRITGEKLDSFELGTLCRACLPQHRATVQERIISIAYRDVYGDPGNVRISMSNAVETTPDLLLYNERETTELSASTSRRFGGVGAAIEQNRFEIYRVDTETAGRFNEVWFNMDAQSARIDLMATREELTEVDYTLNQVAISLDAAKAEIELRATTETTDKLADRLTGAEATLKVQSEQIEAKASQYDLDALGNRVTTAESTLTVQADQISQTVRKGEVISSINQTAEEIKIQASRINLSGYVTVSELDAAVADINIAFGNTIATHTLEANSALIGYMTYHDEYCIWKSKTVQTSIPNFTKATVTLANGNSIRVVTGWADAPSSYQSTMYYLSHD